MQEVTLFPPQSASSVPLDTSLMIWPQSVIPVMSALMLPTLDLSDAASPKPEAMLTKREHAKPKFALLEATAQKVLLSPLTAKPETTALKGLLLGLLAQLVPTTPTPVLLLLQSVWLAMLALTAPPKGSLPLPDSAQLDTTV